jgi:hypothetical protein
MSRTLACNPSTQGNGLPLGQAYLLPRPCSAHSLEAGWRARCAAWNAHQTWRYDLHHARFHSRRVILPLLRLSNVCVTVGELRPWARNTAAGTPSTSWPVSARTCGLFAIVLHVRNTVLKHQRAACIVPVSPGCSTFAAGRCARVRVRRMPVLQAGVPSGRFTLMSNMA